MAHSIPHTLDADAGNAATANGYQAELTRLRDENRQLKEQLAWQRALWRVPHTTLGAADKVLLPALCDMLTEQAKRQPDATDYAVYVPKLAQATGLSPSTVSSRLQHIEACKGIERRHVTVTTSTGERGTQLRIRRLAALDTPAQLVAPEPRTHGGKRIACAKCHGTNVKVTTVSECRSCGHVSTNRLQDYEPDAAAAASEPSPQATTDKQLACQVNNQQEASEHTNGGGVLAHAETAALLDETTDTQLACRFLAQLAGDGKVIEQQRRKTAKYLPAGDMFTLAMASQHLDGTHTYGTTLQRADGRTLALCVESDDKAGTDVLAAAALQLVETGAYATLETSPSAHHPGGGVLWLWFDELVDAAAARATLLHHAPQLAAFVEYWPQYGNGRGRRLPGGRYVRPALPALDGKPAQPAVDAWCETHFVTCEMLTGINVLQRVARDERTPAAWVTEQPAQLVETPTNADAVDTSPCLVISTERVPLATATRRRPAALDDAVWQAKYGATAATVWQAFDEAFAAAWFNERHRLTDILDANAKGYARATWRDERTASVKLYADGSWRDYGNAGDGPAHGDVLDAYCLVHGKAKATVLADVARGIVQEVRQALETAASDGAVPAWLLDILTEAGWRHYDALRAKRDSQQPIRFGRGGVRHGA